MANFAIQMMGFSMAVIGFIGLIASTTMVEWKASSYAGDNIVTAQAMYEGLWKSCVSQSTGQVQCKVYDSLLQVPAQIQATRALMITSILFSGFAILVAMVGMKCTTCLADAPEQKNKVAVAGGALFIVAGLCALVGTSWFANRIAVDFYNPFTPTNARYEFGAALFVGWGAMALAILGGAFLCCQCKGASSNSRQAPRYPKSVQPTVTPASGYV
ncbi:claudin-1-like [Scleropages formosus]|uniref:Claudin n=1 Tax=Scleropages formosus TaxID=113540 RepID=A0A8C9RIG2_SCLFO|nr:claudin-1-like [Scleropages formosus]